VKKLLVLFLILGSSLKAQECSPFFDIPSYELSNNKSAAIGYVACVHARGVVAEVGYDNVFVGILAMGQGHHGAAYTFLQYEYRIKNVSFYGGPAYRLNHNPSLLIGRVGTDIKIYKRVWGTLSVLQVNTELNYIHFGFKLVL